MGISKTQPVEILEQHYPLLFETYALREGSGGGGKSRGGFGVVTVSVSCAGRKGPSFLMDHGRYGPPGMTGGDPGSPNEIRVGQADTSRHRNMSPKVKATC
ncbi:MAG: hypothetical protein CM1200mP20_06270 [Pseudomonadota bacterium]|nr:MAG: hypothetical protein CM1200mP20_06270 [Pseudomonadota bacterium]